PTEVALRWGQSATVASFAVWLVDASLQRQVTRAHGGTATQPPPSTRWPAPTCWIALALILTCFGLGLGVWYVESRFGMTAPSPSWATTSVVKHGPYQTF